MLDKEETLTLLSEPLIVKEERDTIHRTMEILRKAQNILKRDTDIYKCFFSPFINNFSLI